MLKNIGSNWVITVVTILVTFALTPFVIDVLGEEAYGAWLLIASLTSYLTLLRGGLPAASVRAFAGAVGADDHEALNRAIASAWTIFLVVAGLCFVGAAGLFGVFELTYDVPAALRDPARLAFAVVTLTTAFGFQAHVPYALLEAHGDFVKRNIARLGGLGTKVVATVALLSLRDSIALLALALLLELLVEYVVAMWVARRSYPHARFGIAGRERETMHEILRYGVLALLMSIGGRLAFKTDALVIGAMRDLEEVTYYSVANSLLLYTMEFIVAIALVAMPRAARLRAAGREEELQRLFLQWSKISLGLGTVICLYLTLFGPAFLAWWIGDEVYRTMGGPPLQILAVSFVVFLPVRGISVPLLMGLDRIGQAAIAFLAMGLVNLGISVALAPAYGLVGVALGTAIPNVFFALVVAWLAADAVAVGFWRWLGYTFGRSLVGLAVVAAPLVWIQRTWDPSSFVELVVVGLLTVGWFTVVWVFGVFRGDPYVDAPAKVVAVSRRILGRLRRR